MIGCDALNPQLLRFDRDLVRGGEKKRKDGAVMDGMLIAAKGEPAVVARHNTGGDPEAKPSAVEILGGIEGLKEAGLHRTGHAVASVGDGDPYARTSVRPLRGIVNGVVGTNQEAASLAHRIDGIRDEIVEDLADIVFKAQNSSGGGIGGLDLDAGVGQTALVKVENGIDEFRGANVSGAHGLAMEAKGLGGDLTDAGELVLRGVDIATDGFGEFAGQIDEVEEVRDCLEGIINFVGDGAG